jgi:RNA polymerase sigma-70 factor (ECF subfamily)
VDLLHRLRSDETLMLRYGEGDAGAFEVLYRRNKDGVYRFLLRSGSDAQLAEDIAQEAWTAVIRAAVGYRPQASFKTWLYTIARNKLIDYWRRGARNEVAVSGQELELEQVGSAGAALVTLQVQRLLQKIELLPLEQREAFLLKEEGFSVKEIAEITEVGVETVRSRIRYARAELRRALGVDDD